MDKTDPTMSKTGKLDLQNFRSIWIAADSEYYPEIIKERANISEVYSLNYSNWSITYLKLAEPVLYQTNKIITATGSISTFKGLVYDLIHALQNIGLDQNVEHKFYVMSSNYKSNGSVGKKWYI